MSTFFVNINCETMILLFVFSLAGSLSVIWPAQKDATKQRLLERGLRRRVTLIIPCLFWGSVSLRSATVGLTGTVRLSPPEQT